MVAPPGGNRPAVPVGFRWRSLRNSGVLGP